MRKFNIEYWCVLRYNHKSTTNKNVFKGNRLQLKLPTCDPYICNQSKIINKSQKDAVASVTDKAIHKTWKVVTEVSLDIPNEVNASEVIGNMLLITDLVANVEVKACSITSVKEIRPNISKGKQLKLSI